MSRLVTMYEADDGTVHKSREEADRHEMLKEIRRLVDTAPIVTADHTIEALAGWIFDNLNTFRRLDQYPTNAKGWVDEALGIQPEAAPTEEPV